jgi:hypothetical protein
MIFDNNNFSLKKQIMDLKKQISEERNGAAVLLSKMKMETEDFERTKLEADHKQEIVGYSVFQNLFKVSFHSIV